EAGRDQTRQADDIDLLFASDLENLFGRYHHAQVDHFVVVASEHDAHDVLSNIVNVPLDGREQDLATRTFIGPALGRLFRFHEGEQVSHGLLHDTSRLDDLRQEHLAGTEQITDDRHAVHQRPFDDLQAAIVLLP